MPLTDTAIRKAKPSTKSVRLFDGGGLYLEVSPSGGKLWRLKYRIGGKEKRLALGAYPATSLASARQKRDEARKLLAEGIDPSERRKSTKAARAGLAANTFEVIGREWYAKTAPMLAENTKAKLLTFLEKDVFPWIGARPIAGLAASDLIKVIERIEQRGALDIARRVHNYMGRIFRYAVGRSLVSRDPSRDIELKDILPPEDVQHHASVTDLKAVGGLLWAIDGFTGAFTTRCALRLAALVFVRPGELRHAEWTEFDLEKAEWRIPAGKMKMKEQHIVPLSVQAITILREIQPLTRMGRYVFPSERGGARPMSENTVNAALRRLGYAKDEMTGHGFRSMASTLLHELGLPHAAIERQLAHGERNKVSAAYNFAEHLPERRRMMQQWADYLDKLKAGAEVIALHGNAA
ncbi:MAG: integrase arm-type DNA-binding domain-containing protein [Burkholderiales bacterium]|nr:integrase arm-type DNA-binding domain-containing protein [Burkholderiales bacterium]